ncbi:MAG: hypothetical protein GF334_04245 [Candidatus Altiarchaeales archaeon]|nr:hypothetical protein [Candidatus Altiarchaeales archaeon]
MKVWLGKTFGDLSRPQVTNFSLAVFGMITKRSGIISELVRDVRITGSSKHKHRRKRLDRFLANQRVMPERLFAFWIKWVLKVFVKGRYVPIAIDWTTLPGGRQCLMAAIPFCGRGIPLMWRILDHWESIKDSQNRIEERLLSRLLNIIISENYRPIVIGDRGFGRATLSEFLLKKGCCLS